MFSTYNLTAFGERIRQLRKSMNLSQTDIRELIGINEDTLRKNENGLVVPRFETLELLSNVFKTDILEILVNNRSEQNLISLYMDIEKHILNNDITGIKNAYDQLIGNKIIEYSLDKMKMIDHNQNTIKLVIVLYFNMSYNYNELDNHKKALYFADTGIKYGFDKERILELFPLYYRKGIAEYHLKIPTYKESLKKCVNIMDLLGKHDLIELYRKITFENYNISF